MQNQMNRNRRSGAIGIIFAVIVLVLVVGAVFFFVSKPFSTRVREAARQATEWTPENIRKDPVGYLSWALRECRDTDDRLRASAISLRTKKNEADRKLRIAQADRESYQSLLTEAKAAFRKADAESAWPIRLRDVELEREALKGKIVAAADRVDSLDDLIATYEQTAGVIARKLEDVNDQLAEVEKMCSRLATDLEVAKVRQSVEDLGAISDEFHAIMDTTDALVSDVESGTSLEAMIRPPENVRIDEEFERIMSEE